MKEIKTEILIHATAQKVWEVLTDFESYAQWNPFITSISGDKSVGGYLRVKIKPPEGNEMAFKPLVLKMQEGKEFRWKGKLLFKGIFDGEHAFVLHDNNNGTTTLVHAEQFSGILVPFLAKALKKTEHGFELMNRALKNICER